MVLQHFRINLDVIAAPAAVDINERQIQNRFFDVHRHVLLRTERRSSADLIAGILLSDCRFARFDMFSVRLAGQTERENMGPGKPGMAEENCG